MPSKVSDDDVGPSYGLRCEKLDEYIRRYGDIYYFSQKPMYKVSELIGNDSLIGKAVSVSGRIINYRNSRVFIIIRCGISIIQCMVLPTSSEFEKCKLLDLGDIIYVYGELVYSKTNELTVSVSKLHLVSKCRVPFSDHYYGMLESEKFDTESRTKHLAMSVKDFRVLLARFKMLQHVRSLMNEQYLEVETPILQSIAGGAIAEPFKTYYQAKDTTYFLRIAPELYLKRLKIAGFDNIYEISKNFRNESSSSLHNQEFTMLEAYASYSSRRDIIEFVKQFLNRLISLIINDNSIDIDKSHLHEMANSKFIECNFIGILAEHFDGLEIDVSRFDDSALYISGIAELPIENYDSPEEFYDDVISKYIIKKFYENKFVILMDHPAKLSPLAKCEQSNNYALRFEFYYKHEIVDGYEENNDCKRQGDIFAAQECALGRPSDFGFIRSMSIGMSPTTGFGIGLDRLFCILCNKSNIRSVISYTG